MFELCVFGVCSFVVALSLITFFFSFFLYSSIGVASVFGDWFVIDGLSWCFIMLTVWIGLLVILYGCEDNREVMYCFVVFVLVVVLCISFMASEGLMFYVFFEGSLLPTVVLVLMWGSQPERLEAAKYLIMYTVGGSMPLLLGLSFLYMSEGHVSFYYFGWPLLVNSGVELLWWLCLSGAFLVKVPVYLGHLWLPKAHVEAPVGGSMLLAGVLLKLGVYGLLRIYCECLYFGEFFMGVLAPFALCGSAITSVLCVRQSDMKALVAYSSVSHMGLILGGMGSGSDLGFSGALCMSISHGLCSSGLFVMVGMVYSFSHTRSVFLVKGLLSVCPSVSFWWFLFSIMNMGAPPTLCFFSEVMLISSSLSYSGLFVLPIGVIVFFSAVYSLGMYSSTQHGCLGSFHNVVYFSVRVQLVLALHVIPLLLLSLCPCNFLCWV